jgi:predicted transcriptional regulator
MTIKDKVLQAVNNLPDNVSIEGIMDHLLFLAKIERGIQQADAGQTISHSEVKERMAKWLK